MIVEPLLQDVVGSESTPMRPRPGEPGNTAIPRSRNLAIATVALSTVYLYLNLFTLKGTPFLLDGDQVYFWMYGLRVLHGERIYQDFFTMHPPGTSSFFAAMFALFGTRIWVTNLVVLVLGVALSWICFRIADRFMKGGYALLASTLFLVVVYGKLLNGTHHWFSVLAVMSAVGVILSGLESWHIAAAGALLGVASFFTQTRGPFALIAISLFLLWHGLQNHEHWRRLLRRQGLVVLSFTAALTLLNAPFLVMDGVGRLWYFQITYVLQHNVGGLTASLGLPEPLTWRRFPFFVLYSSMYVLLPIVYAVSLYRCVRIRNRDTASKGWQPVVLLSLVGLCLLTEVAFNVNWLRVFVVSMPGLILLIWIVSEAGKVRRRYAVTLLWVVVAGLAVRQTWARHTDRLSIVLPAGQAVVSPQNFEKLDWLRQQTKPGDFLFEAAWPNFYLPLHLRNPVFLDLLERSDLTSVKYVELSIRQLESSRTRYILWAPRLDLPDLFNGPEQYHLGTFRDYMHSHYRRVRSFSDQDEVWERD